MNVLAILQDHRGFIWLGTDNGLNRFDGYRVEVIDLEPSGWVRALWEDGDGYLWIGTRGGGLHRYDPRRTELVNFRHDPDDLGSLGHDNVWVLYGDADGELWIGTEAGLDRLDRETGRFEHYRYDPYRGLQRPTVRALARDTSGTLWLGTTEGLDRLDEPGATGASVFRQYRHDPADPGSLCAGTVRALYADPGGDLWVGTEGGLDRLDMATGTFHHYPLGPPGSEGGAALVSAIERDPSGDLWVGVLGGGLVRLEPDSGRIWYYRHDPLDPASLGHDAVLEVYRDRQGVLWVGTAPGGAHYFDPDSGHFDHYQHDRRDPHSLAGDVVLEIHEDTDGSVWVGTMGAGLDRYEPRSGRFEHFRNDPQDPSSLASNLVFAITSDGEDRIWIGTNAGLDRFEPTTRTFTHFRHDPEDPHSLGNHQIRTLHTDELGRLWVGTESGLDLFDPRSERSRRFRHDPEDPSSLPDKTILALEDGAGGSLWIGTMGAGLGRYDPNTERFEHHRYDPEDAGSLASDRIRCLYRDRKGNLWVGTDGYGLDLLKNGGPPRFRHYTEADGLADDVVQGILEDSLGRLWISTNRGLSIFEPGAGRWIRFDDRDGLQDIEFNFGARHLGAGGRMYFGGIRGFNVFRPEDFRTGGPPPPVAITSFKVLERDFATASAVPHLESVRLSFALRHFSAEFAALGFVRSDKSSYRYLLEGFDEGWIEAGARRFASYTNVPPGDYVFRVQASNRLGVWNEDGAALSITVERPLWLTWWAYTLYGLALVTLASGYASWQHREAARERSIAARERAVAAERSHQLAERDQLLRERERLIADLETQHEELERFVYAVSHDLKSPLITIRGFLGFLRRDLEDHFGERQRKHAERIDNATATMARQIDELLELSRVGRITHPPEEIDLAELAREAAEQVAGRIAERGVEVVVAGDFPPVVSDRPRLLQALQNLIDNAVKFMGCQEQPRIEIGWRPPAEGEAEHAIFYVRDNGTGIDPRHHEKIFGLFDRLDRQKEGTGFGLALVKRILEEQGGRIWVESEGEGRGSTFCFTLAADGHVQGLTELPRR